MMQSTNTHTGCRHHLLLPLLCLLAAMAQPALTRCTAHPYWGETTSSSSSSSSPQLNISDTSVPPSRHQLLRQLIKNQTIVENLEEIYERRALALMKAIEKRKGNKTQCSEDAEHRPLSDDDLRRACAGETMSAALIDDVRDALNASAALNASFEEENVVLAVRVAHAHMTFAAAYHRLAQCDEKALGKNYGKLKAVGDHLEERVLPTVCTVRHDLHLAIITTDTNVTSTVVTQVDPCPGNSSSVSRDTVLSNTEELVCAAHRSISQAKEVLNSFH